MAQPTETTAIPIPAAQGNLFALLPRGHRAYKSELEEEFLSPREQRLVKKLPH